jgi:hypothetical protein
VNLKIVLAVILFAQGCATVHDGGHQEVRVASEPAGATVEIHCGKPQASTVTPAVLHLSRRAESCALLLTRSGFRPEVVTFDSQPGGWTSNFAAPVTGGAVSATRRTQYAFVGFLAGWRLGGLGFGMNAFTDATWYRRPVEVHVSMTPE